MLCVNQCCCLDNYNLVIFFQKLQIKAGIYFSFVLVWCPCLLHRARAWLYKTDLGYEVLLFWVSWAVKDRMKSKKTNKKNILRLVFTRFFFHFSEVNDGCANKSDRHLYFAHTMNYWKLSSCNWTAFGSWTMFRLSSQRLERGFESITGWIQILSYI